MLLTTSMTMHVLKLFDQLGRIRCNLHSTLIVQERVVLIGIHDACAFGVTFLDQQHSAGRFCLLLHGGSLS